MNFLEALSLGTTAPLARLLVVGGALHLRADAASLDQFLKSLERTLNVLTGPKPHPQSQYPFRDDLRRSKTNQP